MPQGYDTVIGDQGVKLSGGQRQRLGIARALVGNPVLLVLDEAMSALDAASESEVRKTLEELRGQMGILIVAHRLAAVRTADRICVFEQGRVVETGTWPELMARRARLYALASAQALDHDFDRKLSPEQRQFFYLPFMHSEHLGDQKRCVDLYEKLGDEFSLGFARQHHDIIERFGRFPHRNTVLGRDTTHEEAEFLKEHAGF